MYFLIVIICFCLFSCPAYSANQQLPGNLEAGSVQQHDINILEQRDKESQLLIDKKNDDSEIDIEDLKYKKAPLPDNSEKPTVFINKININSSSILSEEELSNIKTVYVNKTLSIDDINTMLIEINNLYKKKNFITAKAVLPAQTIKGGILNIELIEGKIGKVVVEGNKFTRKPYIIGKFSQKQGDVFNIKKLEQDIIRFNDVNDVKLKGKIKAGEAFSETDIYLKAYEPNPFHFVPTFDNTGRESIGILKSGIAIAHDSLLGYRDKLTLGTSLAHGTTAAYANYGIPVGNKGTRLNGLFSYNHIKIIEGDFEPLNVTGDSFIYGINISQPLISNKKVKLYGDIGFNFKESTTYFDKFKTQDTPLRTLSTGLSADVNDKYGVWHTGHSFSTGVKILGGHKSFFKYEGNMYRVQRLPKGIIGLFRASTLLSPNDNLPSTEQFQIGGSSTIRGFSEGLLIGNNGYYTSAEFIVPLSFLPEKFCKIPLRKMIKGNLFIDHGAAYPYKADGRPANQYDYLTSAGMGLRINFSDYISGVFNWGFGMGTRESNQPTARFHFSLQANPLQFLNKETL
ncbi:MAG TPA: hypothetical protein DDW90_07955 [Cyanobacteria bacterium UBA9971]|nr:hypothetical protein [Cyanobacteria bacterium UBA9971]